MSRIGLYFRNLPLGKKVVLTMVGMSLTLTFLISFFLFNDSSKVLMNQAKLIVTNTSEKNQLNFNYSITETENTAFRLSKDEEFTEFMQRYATNQALNENISFDFQMSLLAKIRQVLADFNKITEVQLYLQDRSYLVSSNSFYTGAGFQEEKNIPQYCWGAEKDMIYLDLPFNMFDESQRKKGYLRLLINQKFFFQSISEGAELANGFFVMDGKNRLLLDTLGNKALSAKFMQLPKDQVIHVEGVLADRLDLLNGWSVITCYSSDSFQMDFGDFAKRIFFAVLLILVISVIFGQIFSWWLVRPILALNAHIRGSSKGALPKELAVSSQDEVGQLTETYNQMVADLGRLFREKQQEEQAKHDAQLSAFQAQIQPHFLYNTLAIISWTAKKGDVRKVEEITRNLAKYYRLVLAKGKRIASLQDELDLVFYYLEIQKIRFSDQLTAEIVVDSTIDTEGLYIMHRVLQPLVENALEHGVFPKGQGKIQVTVCQTDSQLYLYVADDGAGASPAVVQRVNQFKMNESSKSGFSLVSIMRAIHSYYGEAAKVRFDSIEGQGTVIEIIIEKRVLVQ